MTKHLTERQLQTIANLKRVGVTEKSDVIKHIREKLSFSKWGVREDGRRYRKRKHSKKYYEELLDFLTN